MNPIQQRLRELGSQRLLPQAHVQFLYDLKSQGVEPRVIYDMGACVLHWYNEASQVWPQAQFHVMEAMQSVEFLYQERSLPYHLGVLSSSDRRTVTFWQNDWHPGGNTYYQENPDVNPHVHEYFGDAHKRMYGTRCVDSIIQEKHWPWPDLVKMDVQGGEQDVLLGMTHTLPHVQHLILELQKVEYNKGAPLAHEVIAWLEHKGFDCVAPLFCDSGPDGDYYFRRRT